MGHSSVTTTEVYSNMNLKKVSQDFPTIVARYVNRTKIGNLDTKTLDTIALPTTYVTNKLGYSFQADTLGAGDREFKSLYPDTHKSLYC